MNKEELLIRVKSVTANEIVIGLLKEFFESNICIPKGTNRHPYADILHSYAEDYTIEVEHRPKMASSPFSMYDICQMFPYIPSYEYRIKPSEPIYEWQWLVQEGDSYIVSDQGRFLTYNESCDGMLPIEKTKRIRE